MAGEPRYIYDLEWSDTGKDGDWHLDEFSTEDIESIRKFIAESNRLRKKDIESKGWSGYAKYLRIVRKLITDWEVVEDELAKAKRPDACPANPTNKMCYLPGEYCCDAVRYLQKENAHLKARLDAVVKECENMRKYSGFAYVDPEDFDGILRVARGEKGADNGK